MSDESIKTPAVSNNSVAPALNPTNAKLWVKFDGHCLKQGKVTFAYKQGCWFYIRKFFIWCC